MLLRALLNPGVAAVNAGDIRLGSVVRYEGREWTVWGPGPKAGEFWLVRYEGDRSITESVRASRMTSLMDQPRGK